MKIEGQRFGKLRAVRRTNRVYPKNGAPYYSCLCECGNTVEVIKYHLLSGKTKSCGCLRKLPYAKTHGKSDTPEYLVWASMKQRCLNPNNANYYRYGGRGITLCARWMKFAGFYEDMGEANGLTLDRKDNGKGYCKNNCRWVTQTEQMCNTRTSRTWVINGVSYRSSNEASSALGVGPSTIRRWCTGYVSSTSGNPVPPRDGCHATIVAYK